MQYDTNSYQGALQALRAKEAALHNNRARNATVNTVYTTHGIGEVLIKTSFEFGVQFVKQPIFTSGVTLQDNSTLTTGHFPRATAGVWDWHTDTKGYYIGAFLFFVVDTIGPGQTLGKEPTYTINHHLRWEGDAIKSGDAYKAAQEEIEKLINIKKRAG